MGNNYEEIEYPLKDINSLIESSPKECSNLNKIDENIEIIYNQKTDIPSIYRCPVCLSIPFLYHDKIDKPKIYYICNCGFHNCSFDYFFQYFISMPIDKIIYKEDENVSLNFCKICLKFIPEESNHCSQYYTHSSNRINNIFLNSKNGNFTEFNGEIFHGYNCNKIDNINYGRKIIFNSFISNYLNFNIIKKIENKYKKFKNIISKVNNEEYKAENHKLYLFAKFLYYVFKKNLSENIFHV